MKLEIFLEGFNRVLLIILIIILINKLYIRVYLGLFI